MPAMFVFLLKVNIALLLFCAGYYLVLRHLTFYTLNRIYLIVAMVFATVYPNINLNNFAQHHEQLARPVQVVVYSLEAPAQNLVKPLVGPDYWYWIELIFWMGVGLLAGRLIAQLFSMYKMYRSSTPANIYDHDVRVINSDAGPFSFWKSIYVNPTKHDAADMKAILLHEQVHVNEWHTLDILLAELSTIFYWFNPGVWLMKKAVRENIEFITDRKILTKGMDSKQYQYSLLNVILTPSTNTLANNFNLSTIKKRIIMMNAKQSSAFNLSRYVLLVPAVIALLLVFTVSKAELSSVTKSSVKMLKALKLEVNKMSINTASAHKEVPVLSALSQTIIQSDTSRQNLLTLIDTTKKNQPELPLYINGARSDQKGLANVNPEDIAKMVVYRDSKAKTDDSEKAGYISVITKGNEDSEAVKAFNERMRKQFGVVVLNSINNSVWSLAKPLAVTNVKINGNKMENFGVIKPLTGINIVKVNGVNVDPATVVDVKTVPIKDITVIGKPITRIRINNDSVKVIQGLSLGNLVIRDSLRGVTKVLIDGHMMNVRTQNRDSLLHAMKGLVVTSDGALTRTLTNVKMISPRTISFADKLIVIDGKEASQKELKKVSADKIQTINNLGPDDAEKKYGDKGKNGAILITTKN